MTGTDEVQLDVDWEQVAADANAEPEAQSTSSPEAGPAVSSPTPVSPPSPQVVSPPPQKPAAVEVPVPVAPPPLPPVSPAPAPVSTQAPPPVPSAPSGPPQTLLRGQRVDLAKMGLAGGPFDLLFSARGHSAPFDIICLGVDANDTVPSEPYFVYYGQKTSPCGGLELFDAVSGEHRLRVNTDVLFHKIQKIIVAAFIDGVGHFDRAPATMTINRSGHAGARLIMDASDLAQQNGVVLAEIYLRQGLWRLFVRAEGCATDLRTFVTQHGVTVA